MTKVVLDTNIFVSSIFWEGPSHKIIELALDKTIQVFVSIEILKELEKVLKRDFDEPEDLIHRQISLILEYATIIEPKIKLNEIKNDPDDNKILECAVSSNSEYIVSGDKHLTDLKSFRGIEILKPREFLDTLK